MKKQQKPKNNPCEGQDATIPQAYYAIIGAYLRGWAPAKAHSEGVQLRTSQQIADDLADMCEVSISDIAEVMWQFGFRAYVEIYGPHGWMMQPDPSASYDI